MKVGLLPSWPSQSSNNSVWPSDVILPHISGSTLPHLMACCRHIICTNVDLAIVNLIVLQHTSEDIIKRRSKDTNLESKIQNPIFKKLHPDPPGITEWSSDQNCTAYICIFINPFIVTNGHRLYGCVPHKISYETYLWWSQNYSNLTVHMTY